MNIDLLFDDIVERLKYFYVASGTLPLQYPGTEGKAERLQLGAGRRNVADQSWGSHGLPQAPCNSTPSTGGRGFVVLLEIMCRPSSVTPALSATEDALERHLDLPLGPSRSRSPSSCSQPACSPPAQPGCLNRPLARAPPLLLLLMMPQEPLRSFSELHDHQELTNIHYRTFSIYFRKKNHDFRGKV